MPYSLVGMPALGYDLTRLDHGDGVAHVLRTALRCGPEELFRLAAYHPGPVRAARWALLEADPGRDPMTGALPGAGDAVGRAVAGDEVAAGELLHRLQTAVLGSVGALDRLVRQDLLRDTWLGPAGTGVQDPEAARAADVLVDAAAAGFAAEALGGAVRREMAAPYVAARLTSVDDDPGTGLPAVDALLASVASADPLARRAWREAVERHRDLTVEWAPAMHEATWALHLADRLRVAADAQLAAVVAFRVGGFGARDASYGVWNALSGTVQATVAADLLGGDAARVLLRVHDRVTAGLGRPVPEPRSSRD